MVARVDGHRCRGSLPHPLAWGRDKHRLMTASDPIYCRAADDRIRPKPAIARFSAGSDKLDRRVGRRLVGRLVEAPVGSKGTAFRAEEIIEKTQIFR